MSVMGTPGPPGQRTDTPGRQRSASSGPGSIEALRAPFDEFNQHHGIGVDPEAFAQYAPREVLQQAFFSLHRMISDGLLASARSMAQHRGSGAPPLASLFGLQQEGSVQLVATPRLDAVHHNGAQNATHFHHPHPGSYHAASGLYLPTDTGDASLTSLHISGFGGGSVVVPHPTRSPPLMSSLSSLQPNSAVLTSLDSAAAFALVAPSSNDLASGATGDPNASWVVVGTIAAVTARVGQWVLAAPDSSIDNASSSARPPSAGGPVVCSVVHRIPLGHIDPDEQDRIIAHLERCMASTFEHPNVLRPSQLLRPPSHTPSSAAVFLVQPRSSTSSGLRSLGSVLSDGHCTTVLCIDDLIKAARHTATALAHIHARGATHGAVTPENLLLSSADGTVVLTGFGLHRCESALSIPRNDSLLALSAYAPPEVSGTPLTGGTSAPANGVTPAADMWQLGVTLFALTYGRMPNESALDFMPTPRMNSQTTNDKRFADWVDLLVQLLWKRPEQRPTAAQVLRVELL